MSRRLFHAIVLVGTAMGCGSSTSSDPPATTADAKSDVSATDVSTGDTTSTDTFPGIMPFPTDTGADTFPGIMPPPLDTGFDTSKPDTFPSIAADVGKPDTFPGIAPKADTFPGIKPPPPPPE